LSTSARETPEEILHFWFSEIEPKQWWQVDTAFDALLRSRFLNVLETACHNQLAHWRSNPQGRLAEIIVLDQFSRNIFRNTARAFAQDTLALKLARAAVAAGVPGKLSAQQRPFLLMPYMHSESQQVHCEAEALFRQWTAADNYRFEMRHKAIIDRFGRYPHRNETLGRQSTPEEIEFLGQPGSRF